MKIHGINLDKKNFWIPFLISFGFSILFYFFGESFVSYLSLKIITENIAPYYSYLLSSLFSLPFIILMAMIPVFFIIRRLLSQKPKKVFYFELPILVIIYFFLSGYSTFIGLMVAGPADIRMLQIFMAIFLPIILMAIWTSLLAISLYFYYKKRSLLKNSS